MHESAFFRGLQHLKFFVFGLFFSSICRKNANTKNFEGGRERGATKTNLCVGFLWLLFSLYSTPSTAGTFRKKFRKNSRKTPETLSEHFPQFPSRARLGSPKPYNSRHLRLPGHFQNSLPLGTAGDASFFSEMVPESASQSWPWNSQQY